MLLMLLVIILHQVKVLLNTSCDKLRHPEKAGGTLPEAVSRYSCTFLFQRTE